MEPRLKVSTKWTPLPEELVEQIENIFSENYKEQGEKGRFIVEGQIYTQELLLRLGYWPNGEIKQNNFEISLEYNSDKDNFLELIHLSVDCCGSLFSEWLADRDSPMSRDWQELSFQGKAVFARYSTENSELESEADKLLGVDDSTLVKDSEDEDEEELKSKIKILGLNEDD